MTRRTEAEYDFKKGLFDERLLKDIPGYPRRQTTPRRGTIKHIDIHHMIVHDTEDGGACRGCIEIWKYREASAHYGVDKTNVTQFIYDNSVAWGNANATANHEGIIVEHANSHLAPTYEIDPDTLKTSAKLVAGLHIIHKLGRPTSKGFGTGGTIRTHQSFYATACPGPYFQKIWKGYVILVQKEYDKMVKLVAPKPPVKPSPVVTPTTPETKLELLHWNIAGSDDVHGYGAANSYRGDDLGRHALDLGFEVFLTCEASQADLRAGIDKVLGKFHPYQSRSKAIWYNSDKIKNIKSRTVYSADAFSYLNTRKWGMAFFGEKHGKKFSVLEIHTDNRAPAKQAKQVQTIFLKWRKDTDALGIKHVNCFVVGDFNWDGSKGDNPFEALAQWNFEEKGDRDAPTFLDGRHLDGVLAHEDAHVGVRVEERSDGEMNLSDHFPISFTPTLH